MFYNWSRPFLSVYVQWGSEFRTSLDFEWSKRGWVANSLEFEWDLKSGSPTTFKIGTNGCHSVKKDLKSRQKHPDFDWSVFRMVGTLALAIAKAPLFENRTISNLTFKCFPISSGWISDPHSIHKMV